MSIGETLGRRLRSWAVFGISGLGLLTQQACSFNMREYERMEETINMHLENQERRMLSNPDSVIADMRYWGADSGKQFLNSMEENEYKDAAINELKKNGRRALTNIVRTYVKDGFGKTLGDALAPSAVEEGNALPFIEKVDYSESSHVYQPTNEMFHGKAFSPKVKVNMDEFEFGGDIFKNLAFRYGKTWDSNEFWYKINARFRFFNAVTTAVHGTYRVEPGIRTKQGGLSASLDNGVGVVATYDPEYKGMVLLGFDSAQVIPAKPKKEKRD